MKENNITRFEVSNFKKFDHLVVENIGQVNLITGDNNAGKTTLLEALLCNENNLRWISYLHQTLNYRGIHIHPDKINTAEIVFPTENFLDYIFKSTSNNLVCKYTTISGKNTELEIEYKTISTLKEEELKFRKDKYNIANVRDWVLFYKNRKIDELQWLYFDDKEIKYSPTYWPYIGIDTPYDVDIRHYEQQSLNKFDFSDKKNIIRFLNFFDNDIVDYEFMPFGKNKIHAIARNKDKKYRPLTTFGDGFQKYFRYVWTILFANKIGDPRMMIDEVDCGVHYLKMKDEWKAIFELSKQTGIQIFATTHSMDCIKAFAEAGSEDKNMSEHLRLIELEGLTSKDGINMHITTSYTHSQLEASLSSELNVRGGKLW